MAKGISGGGGMGLVARIAVDADLNPFQQQVDEAVRNALVKFGLLKEDVNEKFRTVVNKAVSSSDVKKEAVKKEWKDLSDTVEGKFEHAINKAKLSKATAIRMMTSDIMQLVSTMSNITGLSKNQTYRMMMMTVQVVTSLISAAMAAATTYMTFPQPWGSILAGLSLATIGANTAIMVSETSKANGVLQVEDTIGDMLPFG